MIVGLKDCQIVGRLLDGKLWITRRLRDYSANQQSAIWQHSTNPPVFNLSLEGNFRTLGIPLLRGRDLSRSDVFGAPKVAVVNEAFAKKFNLGVDAVGKRIRTGGGGGELDIEIVGLARNAKIQRSER